MKPSTDVPNASGAPDAPGNASPEAVDIGLAPVPNGVHLHFRQVATGLTLDFVLEADHAIGLAGALLHFAHIGKHADPPTYS
jgi:hypothetical protein